MSIYPSPDKLDNVESKYALVIMSAKRARQIKDGARRLAETRSTNPLTIALDEIANGAIISRMVEDPTAAAHKAALKPAEPSLEDIIGAGPVLAIEPETDSTAAQAAALRSAEPDSEEDLLDEDSDEELRPVDAFALESPELITDIDEEEDIIPPDLEDE